MAFNKLAFKSISDKQLSVVLVDDEKTIPDDYQLVGMVIKFDTDDVYWDDLVKFSDGAIKNKVHVKGKDIYTYVATVNGRRIAREGDVLIKSSKENNNSPKVLVPRKAFEDDMWWLLQDMQRDAQNG